jgi:release factor glutamine methyltransferase
MNGTDVNVIQSDLFSNIKDKYDIIFFNSVYIPRSIGEKLGVDIINDYKSDWCGGEDGTEVITRFLATAGRFLTNNGEILLA